MGLCNNYNLIIIGLEDYVFTYFIDGPLALYHVIEVMLTDLFQAGQDQATLVARDGHSCPRVGHGSPGGPTGRGGGSHEHVQPGGGDGT